MVTRTLRALWPDDVARSIGRRGSFLVLLGVAWILIGLSVLFVEPSPIAQSALGILGYEWRAAGWLITGSVAIAFAKAVNDTVGFVALYVMPAFRTVAYLLAWVQSDPIDTYDWWWLVVAVVAGLLFLIRGEMKHLSSGRLLALFVLGMSSALLTLWMVALPTSKAGEPTAWISAVIWGTFLAVIVLVAGWKEPPSRAGPAQTAYEAIYDAR